MCKVLSEFEDLKALITLMDAYDFNYLSTDDLEEIDFIADDLDIKISDFCEEIDNMYNDDERIYEIFTIWYEEINSQYLNAKMKIEKLICR